MPCGQGKLSLQSLFVADGTPVVVLEEGEKATASQVGRDRDGRLGVSSAASMEAAA